jgi:hypothetical protein
MRNWILMGGLAAAIALPLAAAPDDASAASCRSRKLTGTVVGGLGGALLGGAVTHGSAGPIIGGLGGAVVGHEIGRSGCRRYTRSYSYRAPAYRSSSRTRSSAARAADAAPPPRRVYYDQYGAPVSYAATPVRTSAGACRSVMRAFYDERGRYVQRETQVCDR